MLEENAAEIVQESMVSVDLHDVSLGKWCLKGYKVCLGGLPTRSHTATSNKRQTKEG